MIGEQPTADKPGPKVDSKSGPENAEATAQATRDNDLTTGHTKPGDGDDYNSKENKF